MKTFKSFFLLAIIFSLLLAAGCKKDDDSNPGGNDAPNYEVKTVQVPDAMVQSNDPGAQQATAYINMMNGIAGYGTMMKRPSKSTHVTNLKDGGSDVYTWNIDDGNTHCTFTLTVTETVTIYKWKMVIDGIMDSQEFNNFTFIEAEEFKDGSNSKITVYDPDKGGILMKMSWYKTGDTYHFTFEAPYQALITMEVNPDNSGIMEVSKWMNNQWVPEFKATWDASGHGNWWDYNSGATGSW
jgi:hypothetical protein